MKEFKDLRKAAFAVGFGVTMGKAVAEMTKAVIAGIGLGILKFAAKNGDEIAQEVLKKENIKVEDTE